VSVPSDPKQRPAAVAEPEPLDDAPATILRSTDSSVDQFWGVIGVGTLSLLQLAEDDRARVLQACDNRSVFARTEVAMNGHAVRGRCALDPAKILDRDRYAVQRPLTLPAAISFSATAASASAESAMT